MATRTLRPGRPHSGLHHRIGGFLSAVRPRSLRRSEVGSGSGHTAASDLPWEDVSPFPVSAAGSGGGAPPSSILLVDPELDTVTKQCARRVAAMVGARVMDGLNGMEWGGKPPVGGSGTGSQQAPQALRLAGCPHLALVATWRQADDMRGTGVCALIAGPGGQICLPGDEEMLASALIQQVGKRAEGIQSRVIVVADCGLPDVGRDLALRLARARTATLIDLFGCGPGHLPMSVEAGVRWADMDSRESAFPPHLGDLLPQVGGVRILGADARGGAHGNAPHLHAVLRAIGGDSVLDVGQWDDRAQQATAYADHTVIVCEGSERSAEQVCGALAAWPPASAVSVLTRRRPWVGLSAVLAEVPADPRVLGVLRRGGRAMGEVWALADGGVGGSGRRGVRGRAVGAWS